MILSAKDVTDFFHFFNENFKVEEIRRWFERRWTSIFRSATAEVSFSFFSVENRFVLLDRGTEVNEVSGNIPLLTFVEIQANDFRHVWHLNLTQNGEIFAN